MKFWSKTVLAIIPALILVGCGTTDEVETDAAGDAAKGTATSDTRSSATTSGVGSSGNATGEGLEAANASFQGDPLDDPDSLLAKRVVYFEFDRSDVSEEFQATVTAHAEYLTSHSDASLTLEGHADERGTREYNIALGERRAIAVQRLLTLQGVAASQMRTVSYGEERPAALGHDEEAWRLNRRVEFIYQR
ncbi:MAG: peptidoglycan-associated lipoprotein Pal [Gammaproteobacteria bacterium]|nr:peptidoglycan-associated lipoprotein Pal [Gammaproteobacteria bacterium]